MVQVTIQNNDKKQAVFFEGNGNPRQGKIAPGSSQPFAPQQEPLQVMLFDQPQEGSSSSAETEQAS